MNSRTLTLAATASVITVGTNLAWLTGLPLGASTPTAAQLLPPAGLAIVGLLAGLVGVVGSVLLRRRQSSTLPLVVVAVVTAVVHGLLLQSVGSLSGLGYLVALAVPAAVVLLAVQVLRRYRAARWAVPAAVLAIGLGGWATGLLRPTTVVDLALRFTVLPPTAGSGLLYGGAGLAATLLWITLAARTLIGTPTGRRLTATLVRHRHAITVVAALGPAPYALVRMTWLTPWPLISPDPSQLTDDTRLWGLLLGFAALSGIVLTLGLIRPWGEVFPRWMPGLAGRPVPVAAAAVPGGIVAAAVTAAAVPMIVGLLATEGNAITTSATERILSLLIFPCWIWGPALALAVWGYVGHRRLRPAPVPVG